MTKTSAVSVSNNNTTDLGEGAIIAVSYRLHTCCFLPQKPARNFAACLLHALEETSDDVNFNISVTDGSYVPVVFLGAMFLQKNRTRWEMVPPPQGGDPRKVVMTIQQIRLSPRVEQLPSRDYYQGHD